MTRWPLLDGLARDRLAPGSLRGRRVWPEVGAGDAAVLVTELLSVAGAVVVGAREDADVVVSEHTVVAAGAAIDTTVVDATGWAQATLQTVLRLTNMRLPGKRVAVLGIGPRGRELARTTRALGGRVVAVDRDPERAFLAVTDGHEVADRAAALVQADVVLTTDGGGLDAADVALLTAGAVVASAGGVDLGADRTDEPRPGVTRAWFGGRDVYVVSADALTAPGPPASVDVVWTARLLVVAWLAADPPPPGAHEVPVAIRRELAAASLAARGIVHR